MGYVELGELSEKHIQTVLDLFLGNEEGSFVCSISDSENLYVQGYRNDGGDCVLELTGKANLANPDILDSHKYKKLILLDWEAPQGENFNRVATVKDCLDGKVAKLLLESLNIFDLSEGQINVSYEFQ